MKLFFLTGTVLLLVDMIYLNIITNYFNKQINAIQGSNISIDFLAAFICYIFLTLGLYYFIIRDNRELFDAFLLGLVVYMVYETTNKATLKNWKWNTVLIDGIWGGLLFTITTFIVYKIKKYI